MESNVNSVKAVNDVLYLYKCQDKPIIVDDKIMLRKKKVKNIDQNRQKIYKTRLEEYNSRIDQIKKQNIINKEKKAEASHQKELHTRNRLLDFRTQENLKNIKLIQSIKEKEIKSQKLLAERKHLKLCKKQDLGKKAVSDNKLFFKQTKNSFSEHEEDIFDEPLEEENVEECTTDSDQSVKTNDRKIILQLIEICI